MYRILERGETILATDDFFNYQTGWRPCKKSAGTTVSISTLPVRRKIEDTKELGTLPNMSSDEIADYDCGMLNDYGGGNVDWWWDYIRAEINRCNEYWRSATSHVD